MDNTIIIKNAEYRIKRVFNGNRKVKDIVLEHVLNFENDSPVLTNSSMKVYNNNKGSVTVQEGR